MTRWRTILRSGHLHRLSPADIDMIHEIGVRTVCDLRSPDELVWTGTGPLFERGRITHHHHPFFATTQVAMTAEERLAARQRWLERGYERMLEEAGPAIAALFGLLAEPERYPVMIHCVAGKDRTGVLSALVLRSLRVPDDVVIADYALTVEHRPDDDTLRRMVSDYGNDIDEWVGDPWLAPAEVMEVTLRIIDERWGSTHGYLRSIGVSDEHVSRLAEILLEPSSSDQPSRS